MPHQIHNIKNRLNRKPAEFRIQKANPFPETLLMVIFCVVGNLLWAQPVLPDKSFSGDGIQVISAGPGKDKAEVMLLLPDGRILVAGTTEVRGMNRVVITRLNANGSLDQNFQNNGFLTLWIDSLGDHNVQCIGMADNNRIIIGGYYKNTRGSHYDFAVWALNKDGAMDTSFGNRGVVTYDLTQSEEDDLLFSMVILKDRKMVFSGVMEQFGESYLLLLKLEASGKTDKGFGTNGLLTLQPGGNHRIVLSKTAITQNTSGDRLLIAATVSNDIHTDMMVWKTDLNGKTESGFGTNGIKMVDFNQGSDDLLMSLVVQKDDKILMSGSSGKNFAMVRLASGGVPDPGFGNNGTVLSPMGAGTAVAKVCTVQGNGRILLAGKTLNTNQNTELSIARFEANGTLDTGFVQNKDLTAFDDEINALLIQPDGKILVCGQAGNDLAFLRYLSGELTIREREVAKLPSAVAFPNPFSSELQIAYTLKQEDCLSIQMITPDGRVEKQLAVNLNQPPGFYQIQASDLGTVASGVYFLTVQGKHHYWCLKIKK